MIDQIWTYEDKIPCKITCIGEPEYPDYIPFVKIAGSKEKYHVDLFEHIPLTEEILKKNGFTDVGDCIYQNEEQCCGVELNTFMFYVYENDYDNDNCHDVAQVFYVHQLQHALRLVGLDELADNLKV